MAEQPWIIVVGGADTGRAPMAVALLRRICVAHGLAWRIESAGVLGHDGAPAEPEARDAMAAMNLDISFHQARSLDDTLAISAQVLIAVDNGTARVLRSRYPNQAARIPALGDLAQQQRDIPDPFRMQVGAWINYAREMETLLQQGLKQLIALVEPTDVAMPAGPETGTAHTMTTEAEELIRSERDGAVERSIRLLHLITEMPAVVDWANARRQLEADLATIAACPLSADDLVQPYTAALTTVLQTMSTTPSADQQQWLRTALGRLFNLISAAALNALQSSLEA